MSRLFGGQDPEPCPECDGEGGWEECIDYNIWSGEALDFAWRTCYECEGKGVIETRLRI